VGNVALSEAVRLGQTGTMRSRPLPLRAPASALAITTSILLLPACATPTVEIPSGVDANDLARTELVETGLPQPAGTVGLLELNQAYVLRGPDSDQLTVTVGGDGCDTAPTYYVTTANPDTLTLLSGHVATGDPLCTEIYTFWTSLITVPDGFEDFTAVTVDGVPAVLGDAAT
jgi:hypothetical protein